MAYIKRNVQIYINWNEQEVMTQEEYERIKEERLDEKLQDDWEFNEWLAGEYNLNEVFDMSEDDKDEVMVCVMMAMLSKKLKSKSGCLT